MSSFFDATTVGTPYLGAVYRDALYSEARLNIFFMSQLLFVHKHRHRPPHELLAASFISLFIFLPSDANFIVASQLALNKYLQLSHKHSLVFAPGQTFSDILRADHGSDVEIIKGKITLKK